MALVLHFSFAAQVIAAFAIFVLGYVGLFATLMLGLIIVRLLYEGAKWIHARDASVPQSPVPRKFTQLQIPRVHGFPFGQPNPAARTNQQVHQFAVRFRSK